jgi:hypothetical protein
VSQDAAVKYYGKNDSRARSLCLTAGSSKSNRNIRVQNVNMTSVTFYCNINTEPIGRGMKINTLE